MRFALLLVIGISFIAVNVQSAETLFSQQPDVSPALSKDGEYTVGVTTQTINNPNGLDLTNFTSPAERSLTIELWYPAMQAAKSRATYSAVTRLQKSFTLQGIAYRDVPPVKSGKFPFVVFSHGYTGDRTIMYYLAEHLASHGYVVAAIDHTDSTTREVNFINTPFSGFVSTLINRAKDQQFVLNYYSKKDNIISDITNFERSSVIGYSMGGYGAINTVGGCYDFTVQGLVELGFPTENAEQLLPLFNFCNAGQSNVDQRWQAMVAFAPWGQERNLHQAEALANVNVPTLYVSGDHDDISGFELGVKKLYQQTSKANNFLLVYENARHNIAPHPAPQVAYADERDLGHYFEPAWNNEQLTRINEHFVLAFLNCYIKENAEQCKYLPTTTSATQLKNEQGKLTPAWKGFNDRWGVGIKFLRHSAD